MLCSFSSTCSNPAKSMRRRRRLASSSLARHEWSAILGSKPDEVKICIVSLCRLPEGKRWMPGLSTAVHDLWRALLADLSLEALWRCI
ncbi:hypothetical protein BS78_06G085200 [Paspalum vaginatum]|nr:hypothetical protein BS78_06G085200 [Paspalum vaginatum]